MQEFSIEQLKKIEEAMMHSVKLALLYRETVGSIPDYEILNIVRYDVNRLCEISQS